MRIEYLNLKLGFESITIYIIRGRDGDILIDTGFCYGLDKIEKWLSGYNIKYIFITHGHLDHVWNAALLKEKLGAKLLIHENDRLLPNQFASQKLYPLIPKYKCRTFFTNICGKLMVPKSFKADYITGKDTDFFKKLGFNAEIVMLPGHTNGSMGIMHNNVLYCGDAFTMMFNKPEAVFFGHDIKRIISTMKKINDIAPTYLATGHGVPVKYDKAKVEFQKYIG